MTALRHPLACLLAIQVALVALALSGIARGSSSTLATLSRLPAHIDDRDEPDDARRTRLATIASAIDAATDSPDERAALLSLGWHESRWARRVCSGHETGDHGKAWGCWQSWERDRSGGVEGQALRAVRHLRRAGNYCRARGHRYWRGSFSLYATGKRCDWPGADARVRMMGGMR